MATVINLPSQDRETTASHVGNALGRVLAHHFNQKEREENAKQAQMFIEAVRTAPNRAAALEVVGKYAPLFRDPNDVAFAYRTLDEAHPQSGEQSQIVNTYDPQGNIIPRAVRNKDVPKINTPEGRAEVLGEGTLNKPDVRDWYTLGPDGKPTLAGKGTERPEGGMTMQEIQLEATARREARQQERDADRDAERERSQTLAEERFRAMQDRWSQIAARMASGQGDAAVGRAQRTVQNAMSTLATTMGGKGLEDGTFVFTNENQKKLFYDRLSWMQEMADADPRILSSPTAVMKLVTGAAKALPGTDTAEPDPLDRFARDRGGKKPDAQGTVRREPEKPKAPPAQKVPESDRAAASAQIQQKAKEIQGRSDLSNADKQRAISRLRDIAKQNKLDVRF